MMTLMSSGGLSPIAMALTRMGSSCSFLRGEKSSFLTRGKLTVTVCQDFSSSKSNGATIGRKLEQAYLLEHLPRLCKGHLRKILRQIKKPLTEFSGFLVVAICMSCRG